MILARMVCREGGRGAGDTYYLHTSSDVTRSREEPTGVPPLADSLGLLLSYRDGGWTAAEDMSCIG